MVREIAIYFILYIFFLQKVFFFLILFFVRNSKRKNATRERRTASANEPIKTDWRILITTENLLREAAKAFLVYHSYTHSMCVIYIYIYIGIRVAAKTVADEPPLSRPKLGPRVPRRTGLVHIVVPLPIAYLNEMNKRRFVR